MKIVAASQHNKTEYIRNIKSYSKNLQVQYVYHCCLFSGLRTKVFTRKEIFVKISLLTMMLYNNGDRPISNQLDSK